MKTPLVGQPYQGRSPIASAQKRINLYTESNADSALSPFPFTEYPTPGTLLFSSAIVPSGSNGTIRGIYRTSIDTAYVVVGSTVYTMATNGALVFVGNIADRPNQVYLADNGQAVVLVDGTTTGYAIDIVTNDFSPIVDPSFLGADFVLYLDTFFIFNRPGTNQFYISLTSVSYAELTGTSIGTGSISAAGSSYTNGSYTQVPLTGGSGTGAVADIQVSGATVTGVTIDDPGIGYLVGDILSANASDIGGSGSGFTYTIDTVAPAFDPLDIAAKSGSADPIIAILTVYQNLWLIGSLTTEIWVGTGAADFFFQQVQGVYIEHGCLAQYSVANQDVLCFWLMQDRQGKGVVMQGIGLGVTEISTPFLVAQIQSYQVNNDAIGFCFQQADHAFYVLIFPTANKGWLYDLKTKQWSEWNWLDAFGGLNRPRANCAMLWQGLNVVGDFQNGQILELDFDTFTDTGGPIARFRTFAHMIDDGDRVVYKQFIASMQVGTANPPEPDIDFPVSLRFSDDGGITYGNALEQSLGQGGQFETQPSWWRLGKARDRLFELSWSAPFKTALNGAWVEAVKSRT